MPVAARAARPARPTGRVPRARSSSSSRSPIEPRHRADDIEVGLCERAGHAGDLAVAGHDAVARLVPHHPARVGRQPDRTADVGPELDRREPHRQCRRRAARRTAWRAAHVVRVVGRAVHVVVGLDVAGEDRHVGLGERDRAGGAEPRDRPRVLGRDERRQLRRARRRDAALGLERVLDRHRHAVQRAELVAFVDGVVGGDAPPRAPARDPTSRPS